jgi:phosphinothricin acetyltransferase
VTTAIRPARSDDAAGIAAVYAPHVETGYASFEEHAPEPATVLGRMTEEPALPWLVAVDDGRIVGFAYAAAHRARPAYRWSVDVSVYLDPAETGRGVGSALYARLLPLVRDLGYVSAYAGIALPNDTSVRLHERNGFVPVGVYRHVGHKMGAWRDVGWWQLALVEPPERPAEPRRYQPDRP